MPIIGKQLGHKAAATTARYAHIAANPARQAVDQIGELMQQFLKGQEKEKATVAA